jgi:hypothetical protein
MSQFFIEAETVRVDYPDGNWIDVKEELSQEDQDYIMGRMVSVRGSKGKGKDAQSDIEFKVGRMALLERAVAKWSFDKPVNADNISRLRNRYREMVLAKIDELAETQSAWLSKNSQTAS